MPTTANSFHEMLDEQVDRQGFMLLQMPTTFGKNIVSVVYTIGLSRHGFPELVMAGAQEEKALPILVEIGLRIMDARVDLAGVSADPRMSIEIDDVANVPFKLVDVTESLEAVGAEPGEPDDDDIGPFYPYQAKYYLERHNLNAEGLRILNVSFPDPSGVFPWQEGCSISELDIFNLKSKASPLH